MKELMQNEGKMEYVVTKKFFVTPPAKTYMVGNGDIVDSMCRVVGVWMGIWVPKARLEAPLTDADRFLANAAEDARIERLHPRFSCR